MAKTLKLTDNERLELGDLQFAVDESLYDVAHQPSSAVLMGAGGYVLDGFALTNPSGKQLRVTRGPTGRAILSYTERGVAKRGAVITEGDQQLTIDLTSYATGSYDVWLRAERAATDTANRILWSPSSSTERTAALPTRIVERWAIRVETSSPGSEWTRIATVAVGVSSLTITDKRPFFFEGSFDLAYDPVLDWGQGTNDRNADRATYGVKDLRTAIRAIQTQLQYIMEGETASISWYAKPEVGARSGVNEGLQQKLGKFGDIATGDYDFNGEVIVNDLWTFHDDGVQSLSYVGDRATPYSLATVEDVPLHINNVNTATGTGGAHSTMVMSTGLLTSSGYALDVYNRAAGAPVFDLSVWSPSAPAVNGFKVLSIDALNVKAEWSVDVLPSALGIAATVGLGASGSYWPRAYVDTAHLKNATVYNTQIAPTSQAELARLNQRAQVMAWGKISVTQVVDPDHFNVNTGTFVSGVATINLDQAVSVDSVPFASYLTDGGNTRPPQVTIINSGTQIRILTFDGAGAAASRGVAYCVIGRPGTFATAP